MSRRQELENIIIGTLAADFGKYWEEVSSCITPSMMGDERNRRIFERMRELHQQGEKVDICTITDNGKSQDSEWVLRLAIEKHFDTMLWAFNTPRYYQGLGTTSVTFDKYVSTYLSYGT